MGAEKFDRRIKRQCSGKSLTDAREDNTNHASALLSGRIAINPIPTGGSKVPEAPKLPSKLRKSKKNQKNNYKFISIFITVVESFKIEWVNGSSDYRVSKTQDHAKGKPYQ